MARKFYLALVTESSNNPYCLLEELKDGSLIEPCPLLAGGEKSMEKICVELFKILKLECKKNNSILQEAVLSLRTIPDMIFIANNDKSIMMLKPLAPHAITGFWKTFKRVGGYQ